MRIDPSSGEITVQTEGGRTAFDHEINEYETFIVKVWDSEGKEGSKFNTAILNITVNDVNDVQPVISVVSEFVVIISNLL